MKLLCRTLFSASLLLHSSTWGGADVDPAIDMASERSQIASQRSDWHSWLLRQQQVCDQRFAVSACLTSARRQQRAALDEFRSREILLNDLERQNQAIDALLRIESNISEESKQRRQAELLQGQQAQAVPAPAAVASAGKVWASDVDAPVSAPSATSKSPSEEARHTRAYVVKLEQAKKRKQELEQRLREQGAGTPAGLALPK